MKVVDRYDFDEYGKERYIETKCYLGKDEYLGKSHGYSYLMCRKQYQEMGIKMGLDQK